jgi:dimethylamine monooxygenase subunit C
MDPVIKSQPTYSSISVDESGRRHLFILGVPDVPGGAFAHGVSILSFEEVWKVVFRSSAIPAADDVREKLFRSEQHLLIGLRRRLQDEKMGLRLYAVGTEPFLWSVQGISSDFGLGKDEVKLYATGSTARRVFCNHCRTITEQVKTNIFSCSGCRAHLFVRDHFSRRLNAYAGVQVDAEVPGEIPSSEVLYS